ncbi:hypothetical protein JOF56_006858 [Kibdelosporangium banguiense]|uniref:Transcriptional regulator n=1 Tax=Kibdelosporangium banguiense TaxID=1365924 RepID=A0ABS4TPZ1_9PSEU|nr:hypothetical protein [Kibdelosporangium banguiense]
MIFCYHSKAELNGRGFPHWPSDVRVTRIPVSTLTGIARGRKNPDFPDCEVDWIALSAGGITPEKETQTL